MHSRRVKISVSLPVELVSRIDRAAHAESRSRSRVLEGWLQRAARERAHREIEEATIGYYEGLTLEEQRENAAMAAGLSKAARGVDFDGATRRRRGRRRKLRSRRGARSGDFPGR
jgi:metal-responsive CopG/Arc/MetJ family transcriptional regulator